ncbi:Lactoylglutathione lyase-like lyase [Desulfosarcina cetonica]|uniref:VOC family protein n=1 Tax=Desulfosarcina cetonica TaxID=90730 RepID=UPI0006D2ABCE|nr:VOC family protein [Desulfosarcina cetonica]VTR70258.1 Lactoylglutathione lyase-like lyase [Desulfosarcina cetonica]
MKFEKIDHLCFAVKSLDQTKKVYEEDFGIVPDYEYEAPSEKVRVARYCIGEVGVEFMEATAPDSEVATFIEEKGEGFFLISYKVDDLDKAMDELKAKSVKLIDNKPRELCGNRYAFVHHPRELNGVLTELLDGEFNVSK